MNGIILTIFLLLFNFTSTGQTSDYDVKIEYKAVDQKLIIEGTFFNESKVEANINYYLTIEKESKSGNSSTNQSGEVKVPSEQKSTLSRSALSLSKDAVYQIHLKVERNGNLISDKELKLMGSEFQ